MIGRCIRLYCETLAQKNRKLFLKEFHISLLNDERISNVDINVVSFSGNKAFQDQLLSIASFYLNVGRPSNWTIYNDGSYNDLQISKFLSIKNISLKNANSLPSNFDQKILTQYPTLKKVDVFFEHTVNSTTIFTDSDILFYQSFSKYIEQIKFDNWYLVDEKSMYFDQDFLSNQPKQDYPLNLGFIVLNSKPNMNELISYLQHKINSQTLGYWSDQTGFHILAKSSDFKPLNPSLFVVKGSDSFKLRHHVNYNKIALRHFVGPVRHKMWQRNWKSILSIN